MQPKEEVSLENGSPALYNIMVFDAAGNPTGDGRQVVNAWVSVCVCVRERERERESVCVCLQESERKRVCVCVCKSE